MIGKLLGMAGIGGALASAGVTHRFLFGLARIVVLAIVSAFMVCAMLFSAFVMIYYVLVGQGLDAFVVGGVLASIALVMTLIVVLVTVDQFQKQRDLTHFVLGKLNGDWPNLGDIAGAFVSGFLGHKK